MDFVEPPIWIPILSVAMMVFQLAWWIGVMVMLFKIWQKVKHLPDRA